jgi:hypothetical protein
MALPLEDIVNIIVNLSPRSAVRAGFNLGLIVGGSDVISVEDRIKIYATATALKDMIEDGFTEDMPEYKAVSLYCQQNKKAPRVAVGRRDITPVEVITNNYNGSVAVGGSDYVAGDKVTFDIFTAEVTAVDGSGAITAFTLSPASGDNSVTLTAEAAIGGTGTGATFNVTTVTTSTTAPTETITAALMDCRAKNTNWYSVTVCGASNNDILAVSEFIETATPTSAYFFTSDDLSLGSGNIFNMLKLLSRRRTLGMYSETPDAVAAVMGYAMGANTRTSGSAFTLMHKSLVGVMPDDLNAGQVDYLTSINANYYVSRGSGGDYSMFENGVMCDGVYFDEILNLDMLVNDMQLSIMDVLRSRPKVAQTEGGMNDIKLAIKPTLDRMRLIGFIAPGRWTGAQIWLTPEWLALDTNDMLNDGYLILSEPIDDQPQSDRDARKAPPIYTPIKLAGAIHTVMVVIDVNR